MTQKIKLNQEEIELKSEYLQFDESTLNEYLKKSAGYHGYYGEKFALAQAVYSLYDDKCSELYELKFKEAKETGASDKLANSIASTSDDVKEARSKVRMAKYHMNLLYQYLKSLDRANSNAQNVGYNLRKEMDKLGVSIKGFDSPADAEELVDQLTKYE